MKSSKRFVKNIIKKSSILSNLLSLNASIKSNKVVIDVIIIAKA